MPDSGAVDVSKPDQGDLQLWSVTSVLGALDKPGLMYWAAEQSAVAAIRNRSTWEGMLADDHPDCPHDDAQHCDVVKWLRDARFRRPKHEKSNMELGTDVHAACEEYALTGARPVVDDDVAPFVDQFERWCDRFQPEYVAAEMTVYHPTYGYAGTCDAVMNVGGTRFLVDYKTSKKTVDGKGKLRTPYPEQVGLQIAAYAHAEFAAGWRARRFEKYRRRYYLLSDEERTNAVPVPDVDAGLVLQITPERCDAYVFDVGDESFRAFLYVIEAHRWVSETSRTVMHPEPLEGP